jgi:peptide/nickel transport system permease protein
MKQNPASNSLNGAVKRRSYYIRTIKRFFNHRLGVIGFIFLVILVLSSILAPLIVPFEPNYIDTDVPKQAPSSTHWLGTDEIGRDVLSRIIYGGRVTLKIMLGTIGIAAVIGTIIGFISGFSGGIIDTVIMRMMDAIMAFPGLLLALAIIAVLGPSITNAMIAISIRAIPGFARIARGQVLGAKEMDYVKAARSIGCSTNYILFKEVVPNAIDPIIVFASVSSASVIIIEATLSFLGLGVQPPTPSWGWMISMGMKYWNVAWWLSVFPGLAIFLTVLSINFVGDALRDALDVQLRI